MLDEQDLFALTKLTPPCRSNDVFTLFVPRFRISYELDFTAVDSVAVTIMIALVIGWRS